MQENSNISPTISIKSLDDAMKFVNQYCNEWLSEVYDVSTLSRDNFPYILRKGLWRGVMTKESFFIESRANKREDQFFHELPRLLKKSINSILGSQYSVTLENSFCSSRKYKFEIGDKYLCFPLNGYNYSHSIKNIFTSLNTFSNIYYSKICPNFNKYVEKEINSSSPISPYELVKVSQRFMNRFKVPFNALLFDNIVDVFAKYANLDVNQLLQMFAVDEKAFREFFNFKNSDAKAALDTFIWMFVSPKVFCINESEIDLLR